MVECGEEGSEEEVLGADVVVGIVVKSPKFPDP